MVTVPQGLRAGDRFVATIPPPRGAAVTPSDGAPRRGKLVTLPADFLQSFSAYKSTSAAGRLNLDFNAGRRPLQGRATPRSTSRRRSSCNTRTAAAPPRPPRRLGPPPARANAAPPRENGYAGKGGVPTLLFRDKFGARKSEWERYKSLANSPDGSMGGNFLEDDNPFNDPFKYHPFKGMAFPPEFNLLL